MANSPNLTLPYLMPAQAQKHVTHNEALKVLDAIVQLNVLDRDLTTEPGSPSDGDRYIVAAGAGGAWLGEDQNVAAYQDGAWGFYAPSEGWLAWVQDEDVLVVWDGSSWTSVGSFGGSVNPAPLVGVNATADNTNRLSVSSPASLFNHEGTDHQLKVNKASVSNNASVLFQTGFSGRAEFGLTGDDDFHVKVSPDGSTFHEGLLLDKDSGEVGAPQTTFARPNLLINGDFQFNQRAFSGGALSAGTYGYDRWKAGGSGVDYTVSGHVVTLASGVLEQVIEASLWGYDTLDSVSLTVSAEDPSADLSISIGGSTGTISAGSGRRWFTFSPGTGTSSTPSFTVQSLGGGSVSFGRLKVEVSNFVSAWSARPSNEESALCARYFQRMEKTNPGSGTYAFSMGAMSAASFVGMLALRNSMRTSPTLSHSALANFTVSIPGGFSAVPTAISLSDGDGTAPLGARHVTLSCTYSGSVSGAGHLVASSGATASLDLDAEF